MTRQRLTRKEATRERRLDAVHEAGHAVGRILTAEAMGIGSEQAVVSITMEPGSHPTTLGSIAVGGDREAPDAWQLLKACAD
jgi:hypothetical protein